MNYYFEEKLRKIITSCIKGFDIVEFNETTDLISDFGLDSLDIMQIVVQLETEFNIELEDDDLYIETISSYKNLVCILKKLLIPV